MAACHDCNETGLNPDGQTCRVCKGAGTNGVDLSIDKGRDQAIQRELNPPPCCARVGNGVWCMKPGSHDGEHASDAEPIYGPLEAAPALWRKHRGQR